MVRIDQRNIIIDAMIFPGNSGGPVLYFPTIKLGKGLKSPFITDGKERRTTSNMVKKLSLYLNPSFEVVYQRNCTEKPLKLTSIIYGFWVERGVPESWNEICLDSEIGTILLWHTDVLNRSVKSCVKR